MFSPYFWKHPDGVWWFGRFHTSRCVTELPNTTTAVANTAWQKAVLLLANSARQSEPFVGVFSSEIWKNMSQTGLFFAFWGEKYIYTMFKKPPPLGKLVYGNVVEDSYLIIYLSISSPPNFPIVFPFTPLKSNIDTQNSLMLDAGDTCFQGPSFFGINSSKFGGCKGSVWDRLLNCQSLLAPRSWPCHLSLPCPLCH